MSVNESGQMVPRGRILFNEQFKNLPAGVRWFAIRSFDAADNRSGISNLAKVEVE